MFTITEKISKAAFNMVVREEDYVADDVGLPIGYLVANFGGCAWVVCEGGTANLDNMIKIQKVFP